MTVIHMAPDFIIEVMIDPKGRLIIVPSSNTYPMIYREAVEVHWDASGKFLYSPKPREWTYFDWFRHIVSTAGDLVLSPETKWTDIPAELRTEAEKWMSERMPRT